MGVHHALVLSWCEPPAQEKKKQPPWHAVGNPFLPALAQQPCAPLPARLAALPPQPWLTRLLASSCLTAQPFPCLSWDALTPAPCDMATTSPREPGLMEGPALGCSGENGL